MVGKAYIGWNCFVCNKDVLTLICFVKIALAKLMGSKEVIWMT